MRCHFIWDEETKQKILIPGCYGSLHREDMKCCTCYVKTDKSAKQFEKEEYNKTVTELTERLEYLQNEYDKLIKIIERYHHSVFID